MPVVIQEFELKPETAPPRPEASSPAPAEAQPKALAPVDVERRQRASRERNLRLFAH
jgi:hypothetical protein